MECALTIAGSDPTGGAGVQADLRVFHALGVHGTSVIAALTAQSTMGVTDVFPVGGEQVRAQIAALLSDIRPAALKTGMLYSADTVSAVADAVREHGLGQLVIDPVAVSSSGAPLLMPGAERALREELFPLAQVVTPNMDEAARLTSTEVSTPEDMERAARSIREMGPGAVIVTGGHLEGKAVDVFFDGREMRRFEGPSLQGKYHGTGCAYSAAVTALLALGSGPAEAARRAKELVTDAIRDSFTPGSGMRILRF